uniref:Protein BCCIP homolog n=1 Tax=Globodera pallida TaxID=36090 RepID=A0A183BWZ4_GLOPA
MVENVCGDGEEERKEEDSDIGEEDESMSEALPPAEDDLEDIERLLTQIFLQADIDKQELAKVVADQSPLGCVFRPVEECEDEEIEAFTYGVLSIVPLSGTKKFQSDVAELILHRSKKHSIGEIYKHFEKVLGAGRMSSKVGFLINERMLNFPARIAGPAFHSLDADYKSLPEEERFEHILVILKVRICTEQGSSAFSRTLERNQNWEKPLGNATFDFPHFQYPVESEIEKTSKFHSIQRDGRTYRPFRRVCLLNNDQFLAFAASVARSYTD